MTFRVGQEVVCIDAGKYTLIKTGNVYEIQDIGMFMGVLSVRLTDPETHSKHIPGIHLDWAASRFRPVQKRKTDISVFTALLNTNRVREEA